MSNRAGGVGVETAGGNQISLFLNRFINNINWDKGLPNRLDDSIASRSTFMLFLDKVKENVLPFKKDLIDHTGDGEFLVIDPRETELYLSEGFMGHSKVADDKLENLFDLDVIDFMRVKDQSYIRVRNY